MYTHSQEQEMTADIELTDVGEFGIGDGSVETLLNDEEYERFKDIIRDSFVPVSIYDTFTCGDERPGEGTLASQERTSPRPKLFGGIMAIYGGLLLIDQNLGKEYVAELRWLNDLMHRHGYHLGGHTDTTHADEAKKFIEAVRNGKSVEVPAESACGMVDKVLTSFNKIHSYGHTAAFARLERALRGDEYDLAISEKIFEGARRLVGTIPGVLDDWRGGHMLAALAHKPESVEVLTDDGEGVHGHRGALIVVTNKYGYTLDRRQVADKVAEDELLKVKKPNAFNIDAWTVPELSMPAAEYMAASSEELAPAQKLIEAAVVQLQIATGITLTKGTQNVVVAA